MSAVVDHLRTPTGRVWLQLRAGAEYAGLRTVAEIGDPVARLALGSARTNPYPIYERMRAAGPLFRSKLRVLRDHQALHSRERAGAGHRWVETGLVFTTRLGTGLDAANVRRDFRRALRGVPDVSPGEWTPRELRHSFVLLLSSAGVPIEDISHLVGHSSTNVTEKVYRKELRPVFTRGANAMDTLFQNLPRS